MPVWGVGVHWCGVCTCKGVHWCGVCTCKGVHQCGVLVCTDMGCVLWCVSHFSGQQTEDGAV